MVWRLYARSDCAHLRGNFYATFLYIWRSEVLKIKWLCKKVNCYYSLKYVPEGMYIYAKLKRFDGLKNFS